MHEALLALPAHFDPTLDLSGILANDIATLNTALGATIEAMVVDGLNALRRTWDPDRAYDRYAFVRQPQRFPDVIFARILEDGGREPLFGIELKGWYLLAREGVPTFRMKASVNVCAPADLLVVYPWALASVLAGKPRLYPPFIESAHYAAQWRTHYWQHGRGARANGEIRLSTVIGAYPPKAAQINDEAVSDSGGNFGRIARTGIMREFIARSLDEELGGIPAKFWQQFFGAFAEDRPIDVIHQAIATVVRVLQAASPTARPEIMIHGAMIEEIADILRERGLIGTTSV